MPEDITTASKSWFQRTEGKYGTGFTLLFLAAIAGTAIYFWGLVLPFLLMVLTNTIYLVGACLFLGLMLYAIFDGKWRTLFIYGYKSLMRWMTARFVEIDPIGILQSYVSRLKERLEEMDSGLGKLKGQIQTMKGLIAKNELDRTHSMELMEQAKGKENLRGAFVLQARQAGRLEKSNMSLRDLLGKLEATYRVLSKMREASEMMVQDIQGEVQVKTAERKALLAGYGAFTAARKILSGAGDERELFDTAMSHLTEDYGNKIGEIEQFMDVSKGFIEGVDLENGVFESNALKQLEDWEKKSSNLLNLQGEHVRVETTQPSIPALSRGSEFSDFFEPSNVESQKLTK